MVKSRKGANKAERDISTGATDSRSLILDATLSPLICRKLKFDNKKPGSFSKNTAKAILKHFKSKKNISFEIDWESTHDEMLMPSKASLSAVRKNCPNLLIDYLITLL